MSFGLGEFFALSCAILWATAVILLKSVGESLTANQLNLAKNVIAVFLLVPTAFVVEGWTLPNLSGQEWLWLFASGYIGIAVADTWYIQALRYQGAGRTAIVGSLYSPFVVILSILFLGETLASWQWVGFTLVLLGILIVVYQRNYRSVDSTNLLKGAVLAASAVLFTAAGVVAMKPLLMHEGFFWMVALRMLAGISGMLVFILFKRQLGATVNALFSKQHPWLRICLAALFGTYLALLFWLAGFKYTEASVASVLNETSNVFIVIMAAFFLGEGISRRKLSGIVLTFIGVLIFLGLGSP